MLVDVRTMAAEPGLSALVKAYQADLWRYLRFLGCERSLAEDLTQETFLTLLRNPSALEKAAAVPAYLRAIARNLLFRKGRPSGTVPLEDLDSVWTRTMGEKDSNVFLEALRACVGGLDERSRRALDLQYRDRLPQEETARTLDLSREGLKTLLRRTKERLKACVDGRLARD